MRRFAGLSAAVFWAIQFGLCAPCLMGQEVVKEKAYELTLPASWSRSPTVPQGFDAGFRKVLEGGQEATVFLHHEVMPVAAGEPPSDTSDMARQWDSMVRNQYSDVTSLSVAAPKVQGRLLINSAYKLTDNGRVMQRRYTYFLAGRTAFVVQCTAPPAGWAAILDEFDALLFSLKPSGQAANEGVVADTAAIEKLKKGVAVLVGSWPATWECSGKAIGIADKAMTGKRTLEISLVFQRGDIKRVYDATKLLFGMMKAGKSDDDLNKLPDDVKEAAVSSGAFIKNVGQVWGYAYGEVVNNDPPD